jgi:RNA polymerase sigma factor (sigma-70 family)
MGPLGQMSHSGLAHDELASQSDGGRLERLYRAEIGPTIRFAYLLTGDRELAADLAHEAFLRLAGRFGYLRDSASATGYLRRVVLNLSHSHFRRLRVARRLTPIHGEVPVDVLPDIETRDVLWMLLQRLPRRQRAAIILRYYEDLSEQEVADVMKCSVNAVKGLVRRGMAALKESLERRTSDGLGA